MKIDHVMFAVLTNTENNQVVFSCVGYTSISWTDLYLADCTGSEENAFETVVRVSLLFILNLADAHCWL